MLSSLLGAKLGATIAGVAVGMGGTALAAYTGSLPTGVQNRSHTTVGASAAQAPSETPETPESPEAWGTPDAQNAPAPKASATANPVGPDATGPAAFGLCTAWAHQQTNGAKTTDAVAFKNLATAVGGAGNIAAYCAKVAHPRSTGAGATHPTGKPTSHVTGYSATHHTRKPTSPPTPSRHTHPR